MEIEKRLLTKDSIVYWVKTDKGGLFSLTQAEAKELLKLLQAEVTLD